MTAPGTEAATLHKLVASLNDSISRLRKAANFYTAGRLARITNELAALAFDLEREGVSDANQGHLQVRA